MPLLLLRLLIEKLNSRSSRTGHNCPASANAATVPALLARGFFALLMMHSAQALAGNISVYPLRVNMDATRNSESLTVRNQSDEPLLLQPTVVKWSQKDGKDLYEPTRDVLVSPALIEVPGRESQVVRLSLRRAPDASNELAYRVMLREVPKPATGPKSAIVIALNISLPIFIAPISGEARGSFEVSGANLVSETGGSTMMMTLNNRSKAHIQIKNFALSEAGSPFAEYSKMLYILPGDSTTIHVPVARKLSSKSVRIDAQTDSGPMAQELKLP